MVVQELQDRDHEIRVACCQDILEHVPANAVLITSDEAHFHLSGYVNKISVTGQKVTQDPYIKSRFIVNE